MNITKTEKAELFKILGTLLEPLHQKLEKIELGIKLQTSGKKAAFYRNEDLKKIFKLSNNTIIKYRQKGILPYTKLGDVFLYESAKIDSILNQNSL